MANKLLCPGCDSYSSSVLQGVREQGKCPFCGLGADVIEAVTKAREHNVSEETVDRMIAAEQKVFELTVKLNKANRALRAIKNALDNSEVES